MLVRAVIDTTVLVSAFRSRSATSASRLILTACLNGHVQMVSSRQIIYENIEVLMRPLQRLPVEDVLEFGLFLARSAHLVELSGAPQGCRDPNDDMFVETARLGAAEYLVTFDRDLLDAELVRALEAEALLSRRLVSFFKRCVPEAS